MNTIAERNTSELRMFQQKALFSGKKKTMTLGSNDEKYPGPSHIPTRLPEAGALY